MLKVPGTWKQLIVATVAITTSLNLKVKQGVVMTDHDNSPAAFARAKRDRRIEQGRVGLNVPNDFASRPLGVFLLFFALLLFWLFTYGPITDAQAQAASISYRSKWVTIQPLLFLMGIAYTIFGAKTSRVFGATTRPSIWGWGFVALAVALGFAYAHYVEAYLRVLGYPV